MFKLVVLSCLVAFVAAEPSGIWPGVAGHFGLGGPLGLAGPLAYGGHLGLAGPVGLGHVGVAAPYVGGVAWGAPVLGAYNYRGPLSLAPGQPANILAADGRPLDTLSVNLDRAAHITAKAVSGHVLKKRSAPLWGAHLPVAVSHTARVDWPGHAAVVAPAPLALAAPAHLGWGAPVGHLGLGLGHGWGLGHW